MSVSNSCSTGGRGWPGLGLPNVDGAWGGVGASHVEQKAESELLEALRHSGESGHSNEPPAGVEAAVPPQLAGRDIRELGARRKTPGPVEETVAAVPPQLEHEEILSGQQDDTIASIVTTRKAMIKKDSIRGVMPKKQADLTDPLTNMEAKPTIKKGRTTIFHKKKESPKLPKKAECNSNDEDLHQQVRV